MIFPVCLTWKIRYDRKLNELAINAETKGEREMYVTKIGWHLFGDDSFFPGEEKYTLDPLKTDGKASVACGDVEGLEWIRLRSLSIHRGGKYIAMQVMKATDVFADMDEQNFVLHPSARLVTAIFEVKFTNAKRPRSVTIRPANHAQYTRDEDAPLVEEWLGRRSFLIGIEKDETNEDIESTMDRSGTDARPVFGTGRMAAAPWG